MSFQELKTVGYSVGRKHRSAIMKTVGDMTSKFSEVLYCLCSKSNGKILIR